MFLLIFKICPTQIGECLNASPMQSSNVCWILRWQGEAGARGGRVRIIYNLQSEVLYGYLGRYVYSR
jgi:hypothetical protein